MPKKHKAEDNKKMESQVTIIISTLGIQATTMINSAFHLTIQKSPTYINP